MISLSPVKYLSPIGVACLLVACGGSDDNTPNPPSGTGIVISGNAAGLGSGKSVVLQNNGGDDLRVTANGKFSFAKPMGESSRYEVSVLTQPEGQACRVVNGSGQATTHVTNVGVECQNDDGSVPPAPLAGSEACLDVATLRKTGNSWTVRQGDYFEKHTVMGQSTYRGESALRTRTESQNGIVSDRYTDIRGGNVYIFGTQISQPFTHETYHTPALAHPVSLTPNQRYTGVFESVTKQENFPAVTTQVTTSIAYLGRETIKTAFGTFETCKFEHTAENAQVPKETWFYWEVASGKLAGLTVQSSFHGNIEQPTAIEVNWN